MPSTWCWWSARGSPTGATRNAGELNAQLIQIDIDPDRLGDFYVPEIGLVANARTALRQLIEAVRASASFKRQPLQERPHYNAARDAKERFLAEMSGRAQSYEFPLSPLRAMRYVQAQLGGGLTPSSRTFDPEPSNAGASATSSCRTPTPQIVLARISGFGQRGP